MEGVKTIKVQDTQRIGDYIQLIKILRRKKSYLKLMVKRHIIVIPKC